MKVSVEEAIHALADDIETLNSNDAIFDERTLKLREDNKHLLKESVAMRKELNKLKVDFESEMTKLRAELDKNKRILKLLLNTTY